MNTRIDELLDIPVLQSLLDSLYAFSKIPSAILDNEGKIHTTSGWQDVCTKFHRIHPEARKRCIESDLYISRHLSDATPSIPYKCPHGLVDSATPIIIDGEHIGSVFAGQLFLEDPDLEYFRSQARVYGFDEEKYVDAVKKVPIFPAQAVQENLNVVAHLTRMLAETGLKRAREKEAERRLRESVEDYRILFNLASDGIFLLSLDGTLVEVNESFARMHGYSRAELVRMSIRDLDTPETAKMIPERIRRIVAGENLTFEVEHYHKDGHVFQLEVSASLISYGGESCIQCLHRDITERKRAAEALKESEARFRSLVENIPNVAVQGYALDGTVLFWNRASELLYGYGAAEALGANLLDLIIPPAMRDGVTGAIRQMKESGEPIPAGELLLMRKDGSLVPVFSSHALIHPVGRPTELFCLDIDLTGRKKAEENLRESEEIFRRFMEHSPIYAFIKEVTPTESRVLYASDNFEQMVGIPGRDMTGKTMTELFPSEFAAKITADDWAVVVNGEVLKLNEELDRRNYISIKFPIVRGDKTLLAGYTIDITDWKHAEEEKLNLERQVQQAQKMESLGVLAGGIAHDFNNLLMVVLGHAELALGAISPMSPVRNSLTEISAAARRAADLSQQMLAYAGKSSFVLERVELRELVEEMGHLLEAAISKKAILSLNLERGLPPIEADPSQIRQIVMNLVLNASEAIGDRDGVITVSVGATRCDEECRQKTGLHDGLAPGLYVYLEVKDTGHGMDAQTRARIFEPFFTTKFTGRGLGLAAVQGIVRSHKGALKVSSEPGEGTTFKVLFPALEDAAEGART